MPADLAKSANPNDDTVFDRRNARYGLWLFAAYLVLYGSFMFLNIAAPKLMATPVLLGMNLAIVYGFCLILAAITLALVYMWLCSRSKQGGVSP